MTGRPKSRSRFALTLLAALALVTCGKDSTGPATTQWDLTLTAADGNVRAVVVEIGGGPVQPTPIAGYALYSSDGPEGTVVIVVPEGGATFTAGSTTVATLARVGADSSGPLTVRVQQAAGADYQLLRPHQVAARLVVGPAPH